MKFLLLAAALLATPAAAQDRPSAVSFEVRVSGEVRRPLALTVENLRELAKRRGSSSAAGYTGVRLTEVLAEAEIRDDQRHALRRTYVIATATDGYKAFFSWGELFVTSVGSQVLVAFERDGAALREGEGSITLVSLANERRGARHVKWLRSLEVRRVPD